MAITHVNSSTITASSSAATVYTIAVGVATNADDVFVAVSSDNGTHATKSIQDSVNTTNYTSAAEVDETNSSSSWAQAWVFQAPLALLTTSTIKYTPGTSSTGNQFAVDIFRGPVFSGTYNQNPVSSAPTRATTFTGPALGGNASAGTLVIAAVGDSSTATLGLQASNVYTLGSNSATVRGVMIAYILSASGSSTYALLGTCSASTSSFGCVAFSLPLGGTSVALAAALTASAVTAATSTEAVALAAPLTASAAVAAVDTAQVALGGASTVSAVVSGNATTGTTIAISAGLTVSASLVAGNSEAVALVAPLTAAAPVAATGTKAAALGASLSEAATLTATNAQRVALGGAITASEVVAGTATKAGGVTAISAALSMGAALAVGNAEAVALGAGLSGSAAVTAVDTKAVAVSAALAGSATVASANTEAVGLASALTASAVLAASNAERVALGATLSDSVVVAAAATLTRAGALPIGDVVISRSQSDRFSTLAAPPSLASVRPLSTAASAAPSGVVVSRAPVEAFKST